LPYDCCSGFFYFLKNRAIKLGQNNYFSFLILAFFSSGDNTLTGPVTIPGLTTIPLARTFFSFAGFGSTIPVKGWILVIYVLSFL